MKTIDISKRLPRHPVKRYKIRNESKINRIVIHCTDRDWSIDQLAEYDTQGILTYERKIDKRMITDINHINAAGIPGITYHDCITESSIYHTLPYNEVSYHAGGYNTKSIAVAMIYRTTNPITNKSQYNPTTEMIKLTQCHAAELCLKFKLCPNRIFGHRELKGTGWDFIRGRRRLLKSCPGPGVNLDHLRKNVSSYLQIILQLKGLYEGKIDGNFGKKSKLALKEYPNV